MAKHAVSGGDNLHGFWNVNDDSHEVRAEPADGLAQAIGKAFGKNMGFGKNILDASCVAIACVIGLLFDKRIIGIGIGTVAAMLLVGRCVAVFDHFFKDRMKSAAGLAE